MNKRFLALSLFLAMVGSLIACTSNPKSQVGKEIEETEEENEVQESANEVSHEILENDWEIAPTFEHSVEYESGEEGSYTIVGMKDGIGFTGPFPIKAEESQKYFWFYFGKKNIYDKPVEVKAIKKGTEELVDVLLGPSTFYESAEVSPESVNMPSGLRFPSAGIWKVLVYIDEELYERIVVEVL